MVSARTAVVCLALLFGSAAAVEVQANPIRKVVTMLQAMQKKVTAEGEKEQELFDKFMCYCKNGDEALAKSISEAEAKMPQVTSDIEEAEAQVKQLKEDLKQHQTDRAAAKSAMAEATSIREKEAAAFAAEKAELDANIAATDKATAAVEKGMAGSFLQTNDAQILRKLATDSSMDDYDREELTSFLSSGSSYAPASGQITGILKQMSDTMTKTLNERTADENKAISDYDGLMTAKTKEVEALTKSIEEKMVRLGETQVQIVEMKEDLDDTGKALAEDKKFLANLGKNCELKAKEHEENMKLRSQELLALADTIKVLNDDDALELFKKTLPGARAGQILLQAARKVDHPQSVMLGFIELALR